MIYDKKLSLLRKLIYFMTVSRFFLYVYAIFSIKVRDIRNSNDIHYHEKKKRERERGGEIFKACPINSEP